MSKKLVLFLTVMLLSFAPISAYADDSIPVMKSLVFQLNQQKIVTEIFLNGSNVVMNELQTYMKGGNNQLKVDEVFTMLKNRRDEITDPKTYIAINSGIMELERAYKIAKAYRQYPTNQGITNFFDALKNASNIFFEQGMKASDLYFQIYNNIMNF